MIINQKRPRKKFTLKFSAMSCRYIFFVLLFSSIFISPEYSQAIIPFGFFKKKSTGFIRYLVNGQVNAFVFIKSSTAISFSSKSDLDNYCVSKGLRAPANAQTENAGNTVCVSPSVAKAIFLHHAISIPQVQGSF